ncbi:transposase [Frateuria aurantia DSM 6220]|uniref:Transposase n=1 Tax=Frateuria aurantia (strain ATCC 33424 / DSM 6220 / KCTC 2777 / LMG 1558 / NBRC 3245 / NCIMB 13370) TaxID=767434 RepID=H8L023_FRAAD|nr:transposase [Frateuria aurantia DSM 6220]
MSNQRFTPEFKDEAVRQVIERGYSVAEVSERLGVSAHSLYKWIKAAKPDDSEQRVNVSGARFGMAGRMPPCNRRMPKIDAGNFPTTRPNSL